MAGAAGGALAAAVHKAGAFGFISAAASPEATQKEIDIARRALDLGPTDALPLGIGLLLHRFEPERTPNAASHEPMLNVVLKAQPRAIWLSFGADLRKWLKIWREMEQSQQRQSHVKAKVFISVGSVKEAREVLDWDEPVDVIVAQGTEAGGHGPTYDVGLPTVSIIPQLARMWPKSTTKNSSSGPPPLLLAAGGISSSEQLVAALALGASGAVIGTQLLLTPESLYSDAQKDLLRRSTGEDTVRSMRFDEARGTLGWGHGVDGRGIASETSKSQASADELRKVYDEAAKTGDVKTIITWSGTSIGLVDEIKPAEQVIRELEAGAIERVIKLEGLLQQE